MNKLLQRGLACLMEQKHYPMAAESNSIGDRLLVNMMTTTFGQAYVSNDQV